ncbi:DEAD/DEAH box helicase family protein [Saccharopolyspora hattusasensis]|uniref:type I restriction endonuclease subunit R n=1 Tax=Saccharopolyspora hattusasensis TaxID=1128679 RepID=UPI003D9518F5
MARADRRVEVAELVTKSKNFGRLSKIDPLLGFLGASAEYHLFTEPSVTMFRVRQFAELISKWACREAGIQLPKKAMLGNVIAELNKHGALDKAKIDVLNRLKELGNQAVHEYYAERACALKAVSLCFELAGWRYRTETEDRTPLTFTPPPFPADRPKPESAQERARMAELDARISEYQRLLVDLKVELGHAQDSLFDANSARRQVEAELAQFRLEEERWRQHEAELDGLVKQLEAEREAAAFKRVSAREREDFLRRSRRACQPPLTEAQVRERLDETLRSAGWALQDRNEQDVTAKVGVAVRELHTSAGYADYLLYVDRKLVGVIEAKREGEDLSKAQAQAAKYAAGLTKDQQIRAWRRGVLPFQYVTDGNVVRFLNQLDPKPRSRRVFAVHQPDTIQAWMRRADEDAANPTLRSALQRLPEVFLDGSRLRDAQVEAIQGLERSWARNDPRALIQMATGAGKTYTAASFAYRFLEHAKGKRVLFLVDRTTLGDQAEAEFKNFTTPDTGRKFREQYNVDWLSGSTVLDSSSVVVSTIQRMWLKLTGQQVPEGSSGDDSKLDEKLEGPAEVGYNPGIPPETFDLIVVDECHRSIYGRWRAVLEYFDAYLVGLTATAVPETFGFFEQNLVSDYSFDRSVIDEVNVPFEVYKISSKIGEQGATIKAGTVVPVRDAKTRRERMEDLDEDYVYTGKQEGKKVISKDRLRTVIQEFRAKLFTHIFPPAVCGERSVVPKTLIFARSDEHAEEIVRTVRQVFGKGDKLCQKITYLAHKPKDRLQEFRNSRFPRIAVTVDMISTGTDVRSLECVFFLREPGTWSLFEQMKGRGARTVDRAELRRVTPDARAKTHFVVVDAVGVTDAPRPETQRLERFTERQISLQKLLQKTGSLSLDTDEVATLAARLSKLNRDLNADEKQELAELGGQSLQDIARGLQAAVDPDRREEVREQAINAAGGDEVAGEKAVRELEENAIRPLTENPELRERILQARRAHDMVIDEVSVDEITVSRGLTAEERAQQTVDSFRDYLNTHSGEIAAFEIAFRERRSPREVFAKLKELAKQLEKPPRSWTAERLLDAYDRLGKAAARNGSAAGVADFIGILRHELGLDEQVRPYRSIVEERFAAWLLRQEQAGRTFNADQRWWLDQVVASIASNVTFEPKDLNHVPFNKRGGSLGFAKAFGGDQAKAILEDLNQELSA